MGKQESIIGAVASFAVPLLEEMGMELVEVEFRREGHGWVLRVYLDKEGGVSLDDCARVSRELGSYLDVEDLIDHAYHLEVSSPGLERPLKKNEDFVRYIGRKARIKVLKPIGEQRVFHGDIVRVEQDSVVLLVDGVEQVLDLENMQKARLSL